MRALGSLSSPRCSPQRACSRVCGEAQPMAMPPCGGWEKDFGERSQVRAIAAAPGRKPGCSLPLFSLCHLRQPRMQEGTMGLSCLTLHAPLLCIPLIPRHGDAWEWLGIILQHPTATGFFHLLLSANKHLQASAPGIIPSSPQPHRHITASPEPGPLVPEVPR